MRGSSKSLVLVRHGESEYNDAVHRPSTYGRPSFWLRGCDPGIRDAPLTGAGRKQALDGQRQVADILGEKRWLSNPGETLVVTSPLSRATETMELMMQSSGWDFSTKKALVVPEAREICFSTSDVGQLDVAILKQRYGSIVDYSELELHKFRASSSSSGGTSDIYTRGLEHLWWLPGAVVRDCLGQVAGATGHPDLGALEQWRPRIFSNCTEGRGDADARVAALKEWILRRPEANFIIFGHSKLWKNFTQSSTKLRNCQLLECRLGEDLRATDVNFL